jgi:hypothetical protein
MKKTIIFIAVILIIVVGILYSTYGKEFLSALDEKKVYTLVNTKSIDLDILDEYGFFGGGIVTYNNQKIKYINYDGSSSWESENTGFSKEVFVTDNYIFRQMENSTEIIDKNNQRYVIAEITGDILNVSRENEETYMIVREETGQNSLYIMNDNNEILVDNKKFDDIITGVAIGDKSEGYSLITLNFEKGIPGNTLYFNLLDDVELWNTAIENELLVYTQIVNNNVIAIGDKNIYYYNTNGKLMWKNSIYSKISDIEIDKNSQKIYMLYEHDDNTELIAYNFEGKVTEIKEAPAGMKNLKVIDDKILVSNDNSIYLIHGIKLDKIFEDTQDSIEDYVLEGNTIRILFKDKLVSGLIK